MTQPRGIPWVEQVPPAVLQPGSRQGMLSNGRLDLYQIPWLRRALENRWPQFLIRILTLAGFVFTIAAALLGSPVGNHNFAIIIVWIAWWTTLKLAFIPIGGRSWCSVCPIPLPGEWIQQGGIFRKGNGIGLNLRWPRQLRGAWLQSGTFLLIGLFSAVTLTVPRVTGWVLLSVFGLAFLLSLVFRKRAFCSYLCPIGGFSGMYARLAPLEVRVRDRNLCAQHDEKTCYQACPWGLYPLALQDSSACGLCMECLRVCPKDNLAFNLRPYGSDVGTRGNSRRLDEPFLALTMLASVLIFSAMFIGPWGWLKSAAYAIGSTQWLVFAGSFLLFAVVILPGLYSLAVILGKRISQMDTSLKREIVTQAQALLPLGLMGWIAFTVSFALPKLNLILSVLNDPLGWGWQLLGINSPIPAIDVLPISAFIQVSLILIGVYWSTKLTLELSGNAGTLIQRMNLPVQAFNLLFSISLLWLLVG